MNRYLFHSLKWSKSFLVRPIKTINWIKEDLKKDLNFKRFNSPYHKVWCAGLPKSGTTLIEKIIDALPYVKLNNSLLRVYHQGELDHGHGISDYMFKNVKKNKYTFLKTHTHYEKKYEDIANRHNFKIIISMRDLRDMLISRYFHILSDRDHWLHKNIIDLNFTEGFINSIKVKSNKDSPNALNYYYYWILNWSKVANQKKLLTLWYEEYKKNPNDYIDQVLNYLGFNEFSSQEIEEKLIKRRKKNILLSSSLKEYGRSRDTFRKGEVGEWKKYFNQKIIDYFNSNIPESIENITFENLKR